jgi:hypothetical protein
MARKARCFTPVPAVSLEELVPADHFYRHVERVLDLSFVRDLVQDCYAAGGRPSVDPVVFFKLQRVLFFEGVRSERLLQQRGWGRRPFPGGAAAAANAFSVLSCWLVAVCEGGAAGYFRTPCHI